jgi:hypothetical protein
MQVSSTEEEQEPVDAASERGQVAAANGAAASGEELLEISADEDIYRRCLFTNMETSGLSAATPVTASEKEPLVVCEDSQKAGNKRERRDSADSNGPNKHRERVFLC